MHRIVIKWIRLVYNISSNIKNNKITLTKLRRTTYCVLIKLCQYVTSASISESADNEFPSGIDLFSAMPTDPVTKMAFP